MKNKKTFFLVIGALLLFIGIFNSLFKSNNENKNEIVIEKPTVIYDGKEFFGEWRSPDNSEAEKINPILVASRTADCSNYYIINDGTEYIVACTSNEKDYSFHIVWPKIKKGGLIPVNDISVIHQPNAK